MGLKFDSWEITITKVHGNWLRLQLPNPVYPDPHSTSTKSLKDNEFFQCELPKPGTRCTPLWAECFSGILLVVGRSRGIWSLPQLGNPYRQTSSSLTICSRTFRFFADKPRFALSPLKVGTHDATSRTVWPCKKSLRLVAGTSRIVWTVLQNLVAGTKPVWIRGTSRRDKFWSLRLDFEAVHTMRLVLATSRRD